MRLVREHRDEYDTDWAAMRVQSMKFPTELVLRLNHLRAELVSARRACRGF